MLADSIAGGHLGLSDDEKSAIREQTARLLANPHFSQSRRFPPFLRYVIEKTLSGEEDLLKERTLGVEIFGRRPDYDTASDPIVRVTAGEIRKRIAQYYQDPGHEHELRIALPAGSYIPQFHWPSATPSAAKEENSTETEETAPHKPSARVDQPPPRHHFWTTLTAICLALVILSGGGYWLWRSSQHSPFDFFWGPVLNSSDPVLLCIADQKQYSNIELIDSSDQSRQVILPDNLTAVVIDDLNPVVKVAGILQAHGKKYSLRGESATNLMDLRAGPTLFIGAFDNAWTLRLTKPLRYHFANDAEMNHLSIVDSNAPATSRWTVDRTQQIATNNYRDYAIVARFTDGNTGRLAVIAAGVGRGGTIVAGEFITDPANLSELMRTAQVASGKKNMEIVLSTQIIGGEPGSPKIEAAYFW
jgi:hypothetical protein